MEVPELFAICKHPVDSGDHSPSTLYPKGSLAINEASNSRKDGIHTVPSEKVIYTTPLIWIWIYLAGSGSGNWQVRTLIRIGI